MRTKTTAALSVAAVVVLLAVAVATWAAWSPTAGPPPEALREPTESTTKSADLLDDVHARLDREHPGRGVIDYPATGEHDMPKSYAMILMAELERDRHGIRPDLPSLVRPAGEWLLANADRERNGAIGWGLPVAWDAAGDGSENPADTVYSISTAIAADALMSWMETDPEAPSEEIVATLSRALDTFARAPTTPAGLIPYSLQASDRPYDTFNSAVYLAGQMQRFVQYASQPALARRLTESADSTMVSLLKHQKTSPSGAWYWNYSVQDDYANDMPHASYVIEGLRTYVREEGSRAGQVDLPRVVRHLRDFFPEGSKPRGFPTFQEDVDFPPRLYDLGIALSLTCSEPQLAPLTDALMATVDTYRDPDGEGFLKYPVDTSGQEPLVVNEYEAYLWRGLVACAADETTRRSSVSSRLPQLPRIDRATTSTSDGTVPFVRVGTGTTGAEVSFRRGRSSLTLPWAPGRRVVEPGLVLQAIGDGTGGALVTRGFPLNRHLSVVTLDEDGATIDRDSLDVSEGSAGMLRAAVAHRGILYVVHYDNSTLQNYVSRFERRDDGYEALGDPVPLPSVEDPGGSTYELVPPLSLLPADDGMHVVAGTLDATIGSDGALTSTRIPNCLRMLEAVAVPEGPVVLCLQLEEQGPGAPYELHGPEGVDLPPLDGEMGVPFRLRAEGERVALSVADSPSRLAEMLQLDLERATSGWLEYGTDNVEGRLAWSQIYYLNGFLDFLLLSEVDEARWSEFSHLLTGMRTRLDQEVVIADRQWRAGRYASRAFTVDRSRGLFAVQTSRLLLLMERYADELADPAILPGHAQLRVAVRDLADHVEVMAVGGQDAWWWPPEVPYLEWPKGTAVSFDGVNVPYNHQNEWAYAVDRADAGPLARRHARAVVSQFLRRIAPGGRLPLAGTWDYSWGRTYEGWTESEGVSRNKPEYDGDRITSGLSFRSIDAMSALALAPALDPTIRAHVQSSAATLVEEGKLYPFVGYELLRAGTEVELQQDVVRRYLRVSSPWELQNAAWAYSAELKRLSTGR
ncbi:MAG: hypothetical protein ABWZ91_14525 [Nocardioides sp.]